MAIRMLWFLPVGVIMGLGGVQLVRQMVRQEGALHRPRALFLLSITWFPLAVWLLNQVFHFER